MPQILMINPNSSKSVTRSMEGCLGIVRTHSPYSIDCVELPKSPPGIETDEHVETVIPNILEKIASSSADAYVLSCFSDPGIAHVRTATKKPVFGIAEAAYVAALTLGRKFGIISLGQSSIDRHLRYLKELKLDQRMAGDRSIEMTVVELMQTDVVDTVSKTGRQLRDEDGAEVLILGCAGLGSYRAELQRSLQVPVIDPVQAGALLACNYFDLAYGSKQ